MKRLNPVLTFLLSSTLIITAWVGFASIQAVSADTSTQNPCYATHDDGVTVQSSADATAVQTAIDLAPNGGTVKVAGICTGVTTQLVEGGNPADQTAYINKSLTLQGGYTSDDWSAPDIANVTILDANNQGRVLLLEDAAENGTMAATIDLLTMRNGDAVQSNHQAQTGGGIRVANGAYVVITRSSLSASTANFGGGGIDNRAHLVLRNSTLHANTANNDGGGIYNFGYLEIANSTLSTHSAAVGGALYNAGTALISTSTLYNNAASSGASGIYNSGTATLDGTLIASSLSGSDCFGVPAASFAYSLVQDGSCGVVDGVNGNVVANPIVGALADNGGSTLTHPLVDGSPAIDAGDPNDCPTTDQRGFFRDAACDIGAYEFNSGPCMATSGGSAEQVGSVDASAIMLAIESADSGGTVKIAGTCTGVQGVTVSGGTLSQTVYISRSITLQGGHTPTDWDALPDSTTHPTILDADDSGRVIVLHDAGGAGITVALNHITLRNGTAADTILTGFNSAGGLLVHTGVVATVSNSTIDENTAQLGGGIANYGTLTLSDSVVSENSVSAVGGGLYNVGSATVNNDSTIADNVAQNEVGGGIFNGASLTLHGSTVSGNRASVSSGAGIYNSGSATITTSTISQNVAAALDGGGLFNVGTTTINDSTLSGNIANRLGGGITNIGTVTVTGGTLSGNATNSSGGGLFNGGVATIRNSVVSSNASGTGGGLSNTVGNDVTLTVASSTLSNNRAAQGGRRV